MKIEELPLKSPYLKIDKYICLYGKTREYIIWEKPSLNEVFRYEFDVDYIVANKLDNGFVFNLPQSNEGLIYDFEKHSIQEFKSECSVNFQINPNEYYGINNTNYQYSLLDHNFKEISSFKEEENNYSILSKFGVITLSRPGNPETFFKLYDKKYENILFQFKLEKHFSTYHCENQFLILVEHMGPVFKIHCFDLKLKKLNWSLVEESHPWILFDKENNSVVLSCNRNFYELNINDGAVINKFTLNRDRINMRPEKIMALSEDGIYFYNALGEKVIGKINRFSGAVEWETNSFPKWLKSLNINFWDIVDKNKHLIYIQGQKNSNLLLMEDE